MKKWLLSLFSESDEASSTRTVMLLTVAYVFGMGIATIFTDRFTTDVGLFLGGLFSIAVIGKGAQNFRPTNRPTYGNNKYGNTGRSYDDERN